jgi:hypothetical protein
VQIFYDLATGLFLQSPSSNNEITQITAKRASSMTISLQFLNNGVVTTLPSGSQLYFSGKQSSGTGPGGGGYYDGPYAVYAGPSAWSGPDVNNFYNCNPGFNTIVLNQLFGYTYPNQDTLLHPDSILLDGEIGWLTPGASLYTKTPYWTLLCYNDVSKGIEGVPTSGGQIIQGWDLTNIVPSGTASLMQPALFQTHKIIVGSGTGTVVLLLQGGFTGNVARIPISMPAGTTTNLQLVDVPAGTNIATLGTFGLPYQSYLELHMGTANWHLDFQTA